MTNHPPHAPQRRTCMIVRTIVGYPQVGAEVIGTDPGANRKQKSNIIERNHQPGSLPTLRIIELGL